MLNRSHKEFANIMGGFYMKWTKEKLVFIILSQCIAMNRLYIIQCRRLNFIFKKKLMYFH